MAASKSKRPRPEPKDRLISFRVTESEYKLIEQQAYAAKQYIADFIRSLVVEQITENATTA